MIITSLSLSTNYIWESRFVLCIPTTMHALGVEPHVQIKDGVGCRIFWKHVLAELAYGRKYTPSSN